MNVIITGGGGFLGSQLAKELLRRGTIHEPGGTAVPIGELTLSDQHISPLVRGAVEEVRAGTAVRYLEGDIGDAATVASAVEEQRAVTESISSNVSDVTAAAADVTKVMETVSTTANESNNVVKEISRSSTLMASEADRLRREIGGFMEKISAVG